MHVFSRSVQLSPGDLRKQMDWAIRITEKANQISEMPIRLWSVVMSPEVGGLGWGLSVPTLATLEALDDKLAADNGYLDLVAEGAPYLTEAGVTDTLVELLYADPTINVEHTRYIQAAVAVAAPGQIVAAAEIGIKIARKGTAVTGCPGTFGRQVFGAMGTFQWASYFESIDQYEHVMGQLNADTEFQELTETETDGLFQGLATLTLVRKVV